MGFFDSIKDVGNAATLGVFKNPNVPQYGGIGGVNAPQSINYSASPYFQALQRRADNFQPLEAPSIASEGAYKSTETPYQEKDYSGALPEFDSVRTQTSQKLNSQADQSQDAINRQFASMGGGPGGASIKASLNLGRQNEETAANAMSNIGFQEAQQRRSLQEGERNKAFQANQAAAGRQFQGEQGVASRNFAANQFNAEQKMAAAKYNEEMPYEMDSKLAALDFAGQSANQTAQEDAFNAAMERYKAEHSGGLLGGGGILGTGLSV